MLFVVDGNGVECVVLGVVESFVISVEVVMEDRCGMQEGDR